MAYGGALQQLVALGLQDTEIESHGIPTFCGNKCNYAIEPLMKNYTKQRISDSLYTFEINRTCEALCSITCEIETKNDGDYTYTDIFESVELLVGGAVIETQTATVMQALQTTGSLRQTTGSLRQTTGSLRQTMPIIRDGNLLYANLNLWFCNPATPTHSLPLIKLSYARVVIRITLKPEIANDISLLVDGIFLDKNERRQIARTPQQYAFYQYDEIKPPIGTKLVSSDECHYLVNPNELPETDFKKIDTVIVCDTMSIIKGVKKQFRCESGMGQLI